MKVLSWQYLSHDLNPIENECGELKRRGHQPGHTNLKDLTDLFGGL